MHRLDVYVAYLRMQAPSEGRLIWLFLVKRGHWDGLSSGSRLIQFVLVSVFFNWCDRWTEVLLVTVQLISLSCDQDMAVILSLNAALALCSNIILVIFVYMIIFDRLAILFSHKRVYGCKIAGANAPLCVIGGFLFSSHPLHLFLFLFAWRHETDLFYLWNTVPTSIGWLGKAHLWRHKLREHAHFMTHWLEWVHTRLILAMAFDCCWWLVLILPKRGRALEFSLRFELRLVYIGQVSAFTHVILLKCANLTFWHFDLTCRAF